MEDKSKLYKTFKNTSLLFPLNKDSDIVNFLIDNYCKIMINECIKNEKSNFDKLIYELENLDNPDYEETYESKLFLQKIIIPYKTKLIIDLLKKYDKYFILNDISLIINKYLNIANKNKTRSSFSNLSDLKDKEYLLLSYVLFSSIKDKYTFYDSLN